MPKYTGAKLIVESLKMNGTKYLIGIHGAQTLPLLDVLYDDHEIKPITVRHEEASAFMASGYAKMTGQPAVCFSIQGPGATNMVTSVASACEDSIPMVVISAQVPAAMMSRAISHKCDLESIFRPITKQVLFCQELDDIPRNINQAFNVATEGRKGPVMVLVSTDLFNAKGDIELPSPVSKPWRPHAELETQIQEAAATLNQAKTPSIFAGGGVAMAGAAPELQRLAEIMSAPVFTSRSGRGVLAENHPLSSGLMSFGGSEEILALTDACIAIGTRFSDFSMLNWKVKFPDPLIEVNISSEAMGKVYRPKLAIVGDAKHILARLAEKINQKPANKTILKELARAKQERKTETGEFVKTKPVPPFHPRWLVLKLTSSLPEDTTYVIDATSATNWFHEHEFLARRPGAIISNSGFSSMGFSLPAAIGAKLARPNSKLVCILGDGSFMMQLGELATACAYKIAVPILVMNDGYYNVLRQYQQYIYKARYIETELNNPDFAKLAGSFGIPAFRVRDLDELAPLVKDAFLREGPTLIDVPVDPTPVSRLIWNRWVRTGQVKPQC
ncbi:MAG: thiamine pyrophosphate-binding protein [Chloroflexi bacterium]|nr:thiamine pyrophosphate-binding protein [Chloroflexota bacterium]